MAAINHPFGAARQRLPFASPAGLVNWWVVGALVVLGLSAMLPVLQSSTATSEGFAAQRAERRKAELNGDIQLLESDVARLTSLARIRRRAVEIGLFPSSSPIYVIVDEPGPAPAKIPAEYLPRPTAQAGPSEPWWQPLTKWLPLPD